MNMDVEYRVHKDRIRAQLQQATQASTQQTKSEDKPVSKHKMSILLTGIVKMVMPGK